MSKLSYKTRAISGCRLEIFYENQNCFVKKSSKDFDYNERIRRQAEKQKKFSNQSFDMILSAPKIFTIEENSFTMEFIKGKDSINFFQKAGLKQIDTLTKSLIDFIENEIKLCSFEDFDKSIFYNKFISLEKLIIESLGRASSKKIEKFLRTLPKGKIPVGICHGDLTFSNIIFKNDSEICLIDFLDTFYESPLQDLVKLRQDTKYNWTNSKYYSLNSNDHRNKIILDHIDDQIVKKFDQYEFYVKYYKPFQIMNFIRILPYADLKTKEYVTHIIKTMVDEWT